MSRTKRWLMIGAAVYAAAAALGIGLFHSPRYSKQYLAKHGGEHRRFTAIEQREDYKRYRERPALHPPTAQQRADFTFADAYADHPALRAERRRMAWYAAYFKWLNSAAFVALAVGFARRPLLDYLDARAASIRDTIAEAEQARREGEQRDHAAQGRLGQWPEEEAALERETDDRIDAELVQIREEMHHARVELARATEDRKRAEVYQASMTIKAELVSLAIRELEDRYKTEATQEHLEADVGQFIHLLEWIS